MQVAGEAALREQGLGGLDDDGSGCDCPIKDEPGYCQLLLRVAIRWPLAMNQIRLRGHERPSCPADIQNTFRK